ncbi:MAG: class I SAM-dependent methyltransferase [Oscillibacter sp.]|nr:class I SAM-dependent methyltransferase [Oscillibacter sp.]
MSLKTQFMNMSRKPRGILGFLKLNRMNGGAHAKMADWAMSVYQGNPRKFLDVGCGGGRNLAAFLRRYPDAQGVGVDYAPLSVRTAAAKNRAAILAGRCQVVEGNAMSLPLPDDSFDLVTAFETVYFWLSIVDGFREAYRVLRPGGTFMIVNELNGRNGVGEEYEKIIKRMTIYTSEDLEAALKMAGFPRVRVVNNNNLLWMCVMAGKI